MTLSNNPAAAAMTTEGRQSADWETTSALVSNAPSMASRTSAMSRARRLGSFVRQTRSVWRSSAGVSAGNASQAGSFLNTYASVSNTSSPANARLPVNISYSTTPNAQTSALLSTRLPLACSGLMYAAVPRMTPSRVVSRVSVGTSSCRRQVFPPGRLSPNRGPEP